jgi:hypothetical protein
LQPLYIKLAFLSPDGSSSSFTPFPEKIKIKKEAGEPGGQDSPARQKSWAEIGR